MHKEAQQAAGGPTSLRATSKEGAHSQLSRCDASAYSIADADPRIFAPNDSIPSQEGMDKGTKHDSIDHIFAGTNLSVLVDQTKSAKDRLKTTHTDLDEAEATSLKARPSYPDINQLTNLLVTSLKPELSKLLASHNFASCLPTELKELPSKFTELSGEIKELKKHVKDREIELPGDLKEIPTKLETFTSTISSLTY
ncbi:hypothetical protein Tco_0797497 [Tanacetum coccineum]